MKMDRFSRIDAHHMCVCHIHKHNDDANTQMAREQRFTNKRDNSFSNKKENFLYFK